MPPSCVLGFFFGIGVGGGDFLFAGLAKPPKFAEFADGLLGDFSDNVRHLSIRWWFDRQKLRRKTLCTTVAIDAVERLDSGEQVPYAYGWGLDELNGTMMIAHSGSWTGYRSVAAYIPATSLWVIVLSNYRGMQIWDVAQDLAAKH